MEQIFHGKNINYQIKRNNYIEVIIRLENISNMIKSYIYYL